MSAFTHRLAGREDIPHLRALMDESIGESQRGFLDTDRIAAGRLLMGLDPELIAEFSEHPIPIPADGL